MTNFNITLVEPEIPNNTGNIGRICVGYESRLHLVHPLGFETSDKQLKRAGLDYWQHLDWCEHKNFEQWEKSVEGKRLHFFSTKSSKAYYEAEFRLGDYIVFGRETKGLGPVILEKYADQTLTIPFSGEIRSFNLANAVAMVMAEAVRQNRVAIFG